MAMNIQLNEYGLQHLASQGFDDWSVTAMPVKSIMQEPLSSEASSNETAYLFISDIGKILFRRIDGIYQASSFPDGNTKAVVGKFCDLCEVHDINYTSIGFEPR